MNPGLCPKQHSFGLSYCVGSYRRESSAGDKYTKRKEKENETQLIYTSTEKPMIENPEHSSHGFGEVIDTKQTRNSKEASGRKPYL